MKRTLETCGLLLAGLLFAGQVAAQVNGQYVIWVNGAPQGGGTGTTDHALLTHLDYASALHTDFAPLADATFTGNTTATSFRLFDAGTHYTIFQAQTQAADLTYTLPAADAAGALTSNGSGGLSWAVPTGTGANAALSNLASVAINAPLVTGVGTALTLKSAAPVTDAAPSISLLKAADAWPGATSNTTGANTILAGGIGRRIFFVADYTHGTMAGSTATITINGSATVRTEGVHWTAATSNDATAISLAAAIHAISGVSAIAVEETVRITPDVGTYSLTIAKTAADAGMTATSGADGYTAISSTVTTAAGASKARVTDGATGLGAFAADHIVVGQVSDALGARTGTVLAKNGIWINSGVLLGNVAGSNDLRIGYSGEASSNVVCSGYKLSTSGGDTSDWALLRDSTNTAKVTDNSTGTGNIIASTAITAVGTATANGYIRTGVYKRAWTNAEVTAFGAVLSGDLKAATLPAKTVIRNAYLVIDSQASGTTTLTASLGRTSATYVDYIVASDAKVSANTVYGDGTAERGTNLTGYDLASYTATTDVYVQFVATDVTKKLEDVLGCTGTVFILTETLP